MIKCLFWHPRSIQCPIVVFLLRASWPDSQTQELFPQDFEERIEHEPSYNNCVILFPWKLNDHRKTLRSAVNAEQLWERRCVHISCKLEYFEGLVPVNNSGDQHRRLLQFHPYAWTFAWVSQETSVYVKLLWSYIYLNLFPRRRVLLEKLTVKSNFLSFMKPECLVPCSQQIAIDPYPESYKSSPHHPTVSLASILILSSFYERFSEWSHHSGFPTKILEAYYTTCQSVLSSLILSS